MSSIDYPLGADFDSRAPWKESKYEDREIEVTISLVLSKTVKVKVSDYTIKDEGINEDGSYYCNYDYSECDLKKAVSNQIFLPYEAGECLRKIKDSSPSILTVADKSIEDLSNWNIDEYEVILED